jgi:soluble cytochrome b562
VTARHDGAVKTATLALTALLALVLTGCSDVEDAAKGAASDAACSVANQAMDEAGTQAKQAVSDLGADPAAAKRELTALRDGLKTLEGQVDGETGGKVTDARKALDRLVTQADAARDGTPVDDRAVEDAQADLDTAIEDFGDLC